MKKVTLSLAHDVASALRKNEYVARLFKEYPRFFSFLERRFSREGRYGLSFTLGSTISIFFFFFFIGLAQDILARDPFVEADVRVMNLAALLRTPETAQIFLFFTHLGSGAVIMSLGAGLAILFGLSGKRRMMFLLLGSIVAGQVLYGAFKLLLHRLRPDEVFAWVPRDGYSFPSGHTTSSTLFYGLLAFFLWRRAKKKWMKVLILWVFGSGVLLIGFSRLYLGVHWPSDILAGFALGGSLLAVLIAFYDELEKFSPEPARAPMLSPRIISILALLFCLGLGWFIYRYYISHPLDIRAIRPKGELIIEKEDGTLEKTILSDAFPKYSETLIGQTMEPISFVVLGSEQEIINAFQEAGWYVADIPHAQDLFRLVKSTLSNASYPTAPVTPAFIAKEPNVLAFEKPTEKNTVRERHHTRYWKTNFRVGNDPVWIATASFDDGLRYLITHSIAPDVDTEREYIRDDLVKTGKAEELGKLQIVKPLLGENQAADPFFTDGKAYILNLTQF